MVLSDVCVSVFDCVCVEDVMCDVMGVVCELCFEGVWCVVSWYCV